MQGHELSEGAAPEKNLRFIVLSGVDSGFDYCDKNISRTFPKLANGALLALSFTAVGIVLLTSIPNPLEALWNAGAQTVRRARRADWQPKPDSIRGAQTNASVPKNRRPRHGL